MHLIGSGLISPVGYIVVVIEDFVSVDQELDFGVPQGSVLGPRIYCMYTKPVSDNHSAAWAVSLFLCR